MAGRFNKNARPKRPGSYVNFVSRAPEPVLINTEGIVFVPFTHSWGPENTVVELGSFGDFLSIYGQGGTTPPAFTAGYQAVHDAFRGEGLVGFGGAGRVLAYRMVGSDGALATKAISNTTPAVAITLSARYKGSYGNQLSYTNVTNAVDSAKGDFTIYVEGFEVEKYTYTKTNVQDLADQINGVGGYAALRSDWVTAPTTVAVTGVALGIQSVKSSFAGGVDGTTIIAGDWTALMTAAEPQRFSVFAAQNLTDSSILASLKAWAVDATTGLNARGKRFLTVVGGGTDGVPDTISAAVTRSASLNDPDFINVGGGIYTDDKFGDLHPSELVSRIAGIVAARGERMALTFARLAGLSIKTGVTESQIVQAIEGGVIAIGRDSYAPAPVRLEQGVTTYTTTNDATKSYAVYSVPKFVRTMHLLESEITEFTESRVIGRMPVNAGTRDYVRGQMEALLASRERDGVILPGWSVAISQDPPPSDLDNFISLDYQVQFGRTLEQVLNTVTVG